MTTPERRPALVRASDGTVRSASAHTSSLAVEPEAVTKSVKKAKKKDKDKAGEDDVTLTITLHKRDRKRLRHKAQTYGWTAEEAAAHVLRAWADS